MKTEKKIEKYPHHGNTDRRIIARDIGTDYFAFTCPDCKRTMTVTKLRQCHGNGNTGRLIINLECSKCKIFDARKLYFGLNKPKNIILEKCFHKSH